MTKYLISNTKEEAIEKSRQEAIRRGCTGETLYWWVVKETQDGRFVSPVEDNIPGAVEQNNPMFNFVRDIL